MINLAGKLFDMLRAVSFCRTAPPCACLPVGRGRELHLRQLQITERKPGLAVWLLRFGGETGSRFR
jgi:hypothetical protein